MAFRSSIDIGVQELSQLWRENILPENIVWKINKIPEFYMVIVRKKSEITYVRTVSNGGTTNIFWSDSS